MRLPLHTTSALFSSIQTHKDNSGAKQPPLAFLDDEPFLIELQGSLELPGGNGEGAEHEMRGLSVGKVDFTEPHKPILRIAHHRLEGKLVTLPTPYAILRTTPAPTHPPSKRVRLDSPPPPPVETELQVPPDSLTYQLDETAAPKIEIVGLVRSKIVFSKRPEPIIELSSEVDPNY